MSKALLPETAQLRWWTENEIDHRDRLIQILRSTISTSLKEINKAWTFNRIEGPTLVPRRLVGQGYSQEDLWLLQGQLAKSDATMRPETTATSYEYAKTILGDLSSKAKQSKLPLCIWQVGKSFRREASDGANAAKLRYFEFYQAEWQCIFSKDTKASYKELILPTLKDKISWLTDIDARIVQSDRLPSYSEETDDIEVFYNNRWTEVASISMRKDYPNARVLEIAIGLDRLVEVSSVRVL